MNEVLKLAALLAMLAASVPAAAADKPEAAPAIMPATPLAIWLSEKNPYASVVGASPDAAKSAKPGRKRAKASAPLPPDVSAAVQAWAAAWSRRDVNAYLAAYADDFRPDDGSSHAQWLDARRARIGKAQQIAVHVENLRGEKTESGVRVHFRQRYAADNFHDLTDKTLELRQQAGAWKILRETAH